MISPMKPASHSASAASTLIRDLFWILAYRGLLDVALVTAVLPVFGDYVHLNATRGYADEGGHFTLSWAATLLAYLIFRTIRRRDRISRFVMLGQLLLIVLPFCSAYAHLYFPGTHLLLLLLGFGATVGFGRLMPTTQVPLPGKGLRLALGALALAAVAYLYAGLVAGGGLARLNLDWNRVYEVRAELQHAAFPLMGYLLQWVGYVVNMAILVYAAHHARRNLLARVGVVVVLAMQVLLFAMTNFKAFLLIPFVTLGIVYILRRYDVLRAAAAGAICGLLALLALHASGSLWGSGIIDRMYFVPAVLHSIYFDYFNLHPPVLLGATVGDLFGSTYLDNMVLEVAREYWGEEFSPNVGWIADAYGNFGVAGIVCFAALLAFLLRLGDMLANRLPAGIAEALVAGYSLVLVSSALLTSLVTGGYVVAITVLWFMTRSRWETHRRAEPHPTQRVALEVV